MVSFDLESREAADRDGTPGADTADELREPIVVKLGLAVVIFEKDDALSGLRRITVWNNDRAHRRVLPARGSRSGTQADYIRHRRRVSCRPMPAMCLPADRVKSKWSRQPKRRCRPIQPEFNILNANLMALPSTVVNSG
jgi:hypothetical protein